MVILVIDDHPLLRQAIKQVIQDEIPSAQIREAATGQSALAVLRAEPVELAIVDIVLPDHSGLSLLKRIKQVRPGTKCLMLTMHGELQYLRLALSFGASGYLTKQSAPDELREAIRTVLTNRSYVSPALGKALESENASPEAFLPPFLLSGREMEVLSLLAKGCTVSEAAAKLKLSVKTVSTYRARLLEKLQLRTTAELIRYA
ncbi:MAG TPA: response regulator transcription factor, partial [Nitrospira sp.]|nr:response regulator transcription factor [Nitrospira sp.]